MLDAIITGDVARVRRALLAGDPPDSITLVVAAWHGHTHIVRLLLAAGADPEAADECGNSAALRWALLKQHADTALVLIRAGACPAQALDGLAFYDRPGPARAMCKRLTDGLVAAHLLQASLACTRGTPAQCAREVN